MGLEGLILDLSVRFAKIQWCLKLKKAIFKKKSCPLMTYGSGFLYETDPSGLISH